MARAADELLGTQDFLPEVNHHIAQIAENWEDDTAIMFFCECSDPSCTAQVTMTSGEFAQLGPGLRILANGHDVERR